METRALIKHHFTRNREFFCQRDVKLSSREALETTSECRPFKDPNYDLFKLEHDISVQAVSEQKNEVVQTPWFRKVQASVQVCMTEESRKVPDEEEKADVITEFLNSVTPRILRNLKQNEIVPIFLDDYSNLEDDESFIGHKEESVLKEYQSFVHHRFTKGKSISNISWQPNQKIMAVSVVEPSTFTERLALSRKVRSSFVCVWSFSDPILPQLLLEAPTEVNVVKFNPLTPNIVAGGCMNGQVVLWDIGKLQAELKSKSKKGRGGVAASVLSNPSAAADLSGMDREDDANIPRIKWSQASKIETGHKRVVNDLCWLPDTLESNFDGKLVPVPIDDNNPTATQHQFATISSDGAMYIWDTRKEKIRRDKLRKVMRGGMSEEAPWLPVVKVQLSKPDGTGDIAGLRMWMETAKIDPYRLCATTEEGEFVVANWEPQPEKKEQPIVNEFGQQAREESLIKHLCPGHFGPAWEVQRHPMKEQLGDIFLTVGDWSFKIWKLGTQSPVLVSPCISTHMTSGRWSPTRPSILFIGTADGHIQIWDLLDRNHEPIVAQSVSQCAITHIEFRPPPETRTRSQGTQWMAVGDEAGVLHIYELPKILVREHSKETEKMGAYFDRELERVKFFESRWKIRQKEKEELVARVAADKLKQPGEE